MLAFSSLFRIALVLVEGRWLPIKPPSQQTTEPPNHPSHLLLAFQDMVVWWIGFVEPPDLVTDSASKVLVEGWEAKPPNHQSTKPPNQQPLVFVEGW